MLEQTIKIISNTVDEGRLLRTVQEVSCFHRIQASPGFRAAALHCCEKLKRQGISSQILSFPATEDKIFDTYPSFQEWSCKEAWCTLSDGTRIADFDREPVSIIQRSIPCDYRNHPLPIIWLNRGENPSAYDGEDFTGRLVFIRDDINKYDWAVAEKNAAGILTDYVLEVEGSRSRYDQLDTLRYTSFWWKKGQKKSFGFVLSPREGDRLADALSRAEKEGRTLTATCYIDSALYDGSIEDVTAFLPGSTGEEVLLTAHLCHPRACANDNASGVAAAMEALRVIRELTESGALPPLKRSIRILLVPEFTGSYAYLEQIGEARKQIVAAMNLDMVGGKQDGGYGPLTITDLPLSVPSCVGDLAAYILEEIKKEAPSLNGERLPMFNSYIGGFTGGSDHMVFTDPNVGIPSLMLGQWPDKFYHTSSDTVDRIDPHLLGRSCTLAAAYAYILATLSPKDLSAIFSSEALRLANKVEQQVQAYSTGALSQTDYVHKVCRLLDYARASAENTLTLFDEAETKIANRLINAAKQRFTTLAAALTALPEELLNQGFVAQLSHDKALQAVPKRIFTTFPSIKDMGDLTQLAQLFYYIDGKRTLAQIAALMAVDTHQDISDSIAETCEKLQELGYLTM